MILEHERHALETLLNFLHDEDFAHRFERSTLLCILHITRVVETQGRHPGLRRLIALQRHKYANLVGELDEFCRKYDYRFAHEAWGAEADAGLRATELLAGKPEVFGNDIHRRQLRDGSSRGWGALRDCWRGLMLSFENPQNPPPNSLKKAGENHADQNGNCPRTTLPSEFASARKKDRCCRSAKVSKLNVEKVV